MLCVFIYKRDLCFVKYLYDFKSEINLMNGTELATLFKMAAAVITKRLKGSSLKIDKKISSLGKAFF